MESVETPATTFDIREPIPGYKLRERIGAGGYGEVWKADAPGGLAKAVKIVYGQLNGSRAERELKALNRMKLVQHPFLLSLERIEVVDGHLVIVLELAEGSLRDRFDICRCDGLPGIPREELLGYMRDAADALDYLYEAHSLQHLDVKPENLLLLSRHVKVADFGLAKDVDVTGSMIGGLTPLYASPEMFDGRPGRHSDQYSLAIVYQHVLTGEPPFGGRTTAQLAAQHLRSKPILSPLPEADQIVVGRALAKSPEKRFSSCRAFVDSLTSPASAAKTARTQGTVSRAGGAAAVRDAGRDGDTQLVSASLSGNGTAHVTDDVFVPESRPVVSLPPLNLDTQTAAACRPTLVVALGGTASEALRQLKCQLTDRFGKLESVPAIQLLALDTDKDALSTLTSGDDREALRFSETLALPLREPHVYRSKSKSLLEWMNRRWLYNIPRSRKTKGIRPLGRLAFVDNFEAILERLRYMVASATAATAVQQSSEHTGVTFAADPPRLFVVAGTSGGTGSGAVVDLAYTLRMVLGQLSISDEELIGILLHSTNRRPAARDLSISNTLVCLNEMSYFSSTQGFYPGEPACGIEPFRQDAAVFRKLYFVHQGDELSADGYQEAAATVAEYLHQSIATPATGFFDGSRAAQTEAPELSTDGMTLRSFGLVRIRNSLAATCRRQAEALCHALVKKWIGGFSAARSEQTVRLADTKALVAAQDQQQHGLDPQIAKRADRFAASLRLNNDQLLGLAEDLVKRELGFPQEYLQRLISETRERLEFHDRPASNPAAAQSMLETIDGVLVGRDQRSADPGHQTLQSVLDSQLEEAVETKTEALRTWLVEIVDIPGARLHAAKQAAAWFRSHIETSQSDLQRVREPLHEQVRNLEKQITSPAAEPRQKGAQDDPQGDAAFLGFAQLRLRQVLHCGVASALRKVSLCLHELADRLDEIRDRIKPLAEEFEEAPTKNDTADVADPGGLAIFGKLQNPIVNEFDHQLQERFFGQQFRLSKLIDTSPEDVAALVTAMREWSRRSISRAVRGLQLEARMGGQQFAEFTDDNTLRDCLEQATPEKLSQWGGAKRLLVSAPESFAGEFATVKEKVQQIAQHDSNLVSDGDGDVIFCYEVQQIALQTVARCLIGRRDDYLDIAARLHSRIDIDWPELGS